MAYGYPYNGVWVLACTPINDCRASAAHFLKKGCITMEILFYNKFLLLRSLRKRSRFPFVNIDCIGAKDGEKLEVYVNGKPNGNIVVTNGKVTIPIAKGNTYRLASPDHPYGVRFNTTDAHDGTDDILLFHTVTTDSAEIKNLYRIIEHLCSTIQEQDEKIQNLSGYRTE